MEKNVRISTHGRLTIPKQMRDSLSITDGQPILIKVDLIHKALVIEILPKISDFK